MLGVDAQVAQRLRRIGGNALKGSEDKRAFAGATDLGQDGLACQTIGAVVVGAFDLAVHQPATAAFNAVNVGVVGAVQHDARVQDLLTAESDECRWWFVAVELEDLVDVGQAARLHVSFRNARARKQLVQGAFCVGLYGERHVAVLERCDWVRGALHVDPAVIRCQSGVGVASVWPASASSQRCTMSSCVASMRSRRVQ